MDRYLVADLTQKEWNRIISKISINPNTECWNWDGSIDYQKYGLMWFRGRTERVHRIMYAYFYKKIPRGVKSRRFFQIHHKCNNSRCINPKHLELVTQRVNVIQGNGPSAINFRKTHCNYGHKLPDHKNRNNKYRCCPTCDSIRHKKRMQGPDREYWLKKALQAQKRYYYKHRYEK